jgi:hypothetical protein
VDLFLIPQLLGVVLFVIPRLLQPNLLHNLRYLLSPPWSRILPEKQIIFILWNPEFHYL